MAGSSPQKLVRLYKLNQGKKAIEEAKDKIFTLMNDKDLDTYERCGLESVYSLLKEPLKELEYYIIYEKQRGGLKYVGD
jgi:hypothetical protein